MDSTAREEGDIDMVSAEDRFGADMARGLSPEKLYDRHWALTVLERFLVRLTDEYTATGNQRQFDRLKDVLAGGGGAPYKQLGAELKDLMAVLGAS